jgi:hypothetical protein
MPRQVEPKDAALLREIRDNYAADVLAFKEIREQGQKDMCFLAGDPWDKTEKDERKDSGRPLIALDELNQYVNQLINNARESKRGITVIPKGNGATDKLAEIRQGIIREIEYKSNAQAAYITAFEGEAQRSYGAFRITSGYVSDSQFDQELLIKRIPNPDTVVWDSECKELDCSDASRCFETDFISREKFKRDFPKAEIVSFTTDHMQVASDWIKADRILIAKYWKVKKKKRKLLLAHLAQGPTPFFSEGEPSGDIQIIPAGTKIAGEQMVVPGHGVIPILKQRDVESQNVCWYVTNGLEVLDSDEWPGRWIPVIPMFGKEMYVDEGAGAKRVIMSLIRLARDPYKLYCYLRSQMMEEAALTPRVPWTGVEGTFEGHEEEWANAHKDPVGFLQYKLIVGPNGEVAPAPTRTPFQPNFVAYESACEASRRAIQSAVGISPLPTSAQRLNEKSGRALDRIQQSADHGSFHFIDNYDTALEFAGRQMNNLLKFFYDTEREVGVRDKDDSHSTVYLNKPHADPKTNEQYHHQMDVGEFEVTISTGPSQQSQRDAVDDFADILAKTELFPQVADLLIKLKNLGPIGEQLAERVRPPQFAQNGAQQAMAKAQQLQHEAQALTEYAQKLEAEVKKFQDEKNAKLLDNDLKMQIAQLDAQTKTAVAEITAKSQDARMRHEFEMRQLELAHGAAHDIALQKDQQAHEADQAEQAQTAQAEAAQAQQQQGAEPPSA